MLMHIGPVVQSIVTLKRWLLVHLNADHNMKYSNFVLIKNFQQKVSVCLLYKLLKINETFTYNVIYFQLSINYRKIPKWLERFSKVFTVYISL